MKINLDYNIKEKLNNVIEKVGLDNCLNNTNSQLKVINEELIDIIYQTTEAINISNERINGNIEVLVNNFKDFDQNVAREIDKNEFFKISKVDTTKQ